jgi:beta-glucan synthesis-associated protein KRE6
MLTSWNKFCFTGGLIEVSAQLPGNNAVPGFWPSVWTMGNLARAGYGATTEGLWPYTYEACDLGTLANQTLNGKPDFQDLKLGDPLHDYDLSFLLGQRLSSCTCPGESHPGPVNPDGTFRGRMAPEIDVFEGQIDSTLKAGAVSQSSQFSPFSAYYSCNATYIDLHQPTTQVINGFKGDVYQQTTSVVSATNQLCYEGSTAPCYATYGFQYKPGYQSDDAYITWINNNSLSWTLHAGGVGADPISEISERGISQEPMVSRYMPAVILTADALQYIVMNLGVSPSFSAVPSNLPLPAHMSIDYIRVYQYEDLVNYGCDPPNYPTSNYINQ